MNGVALRVGMVGAGMIFDETYRPLFERAHRAGIYEPSVGPLDVRMAALASRTGRRAEALRDAAVPEGRLPDFACPAGEQALAELLALPLEAVCVATPDDRHFETARAALAAGRHVLIEKPSVLNVAELDELVALAQARGVLAKVVYHKLLDPDHKKLRTLVADGLLRHVNNGYCSLLEPKRVAAAFAEWIAGRNPATYVAVHYIKLIDFTFGLRLRSVQATGQRGQVAAPDGATWDSVQTRLVYADAAGREAAFDIHTSWVAPDNFPGYVEQEVQFRFDNGVWNAHSRRRGVECTIEGRTPHEIKTSLNNHYNADLLEPWGDRGPRGYGLEAIERFFREVAFVEQGGPTAARQERLALMRSLAYNDLEADRQVVAAVQATEAILARQTAGEPNCVVDVNDPSGGLVLRRPGVEGVDVLYGGRV